MFDPETGEVKLRKEEEILEIGDKDPLVNNKTFQFYSPEELKKMKKKKGADPNSPLAAQDTQRFSTMRAASERYDRSSSPPDNLTRGVTLSASQAASKAMLGDMGDDAVGDDQSKVFKEGLRSYGGIDIAELDGQKKAEEEENKHRPKFHARDRHQVIFDFVPEKGSYDQMMVKKNHRWL